jgi:hypothetical protein
MADPDTGNVRGHTVEDTTVLSTQSGDLQNPLGQQCVPVGGVAQSLEPWASGTLSTRDTAQDMGTVPITPSSAWTTITHSPHRHVHSLKSGQACQAQET